MAWRKQFEDSNLVASHIPTAPLVPEVTSEQEIAILAINFWAESKCHVNGVHLREEMESKNRAARESYVARRNRAARESSKMSLSADDLIVRSLAYREGLAVELQAALYKWLHSGAAAPASTLSLDVGPPDESDEEYVPYEEHFRTKSFAPMAATMLKRGDEENASQQMEYASQKPMGPDNEVETSGPPDAKR